MTQRTTSSARRQDNQSFPLPEVQHARLGDEMGKRFLQIDALCPYLSSTNIALVLRKMEIPCPYGSWNSHSVDKARKNFKPDKLYHNFVIEKNARHLLNISLKNNLEIVHSIINIINVIKSSSSVKKQYIYFNIYFNTKIQESVINKDIHEVISTSLDTVNIDISWLNSLNRNTKNFIYRTFIIDFLECKFWSSATQFLHSNILDIELFPFYILKILHSDGGKLSSFPKFPPYIVNILKSFSFLMQEKYEAVINSVLLAQKQWRKDINTKNASFTSIIAMVLNLSRLATREQLETMQRECLQLSAKTGELPGDEVGFRALLRLHNAITGTADDTSDEIYVYRPKDNRTPNLIARILHYHACALMQDTEWLPSCIALRDSLQDIMPSLAAILDDAVASGGGPTIDLKIPHPDWRKFLKRTKRWEVQLSALEAVCAATKKKQNTKPHRLVWFLDASRQFVFPKTQIQQSNGTWSRGQNLAIRRLVEETDSLDWLTPQDKEMSRAFRVVWNQWSFIPEIGFTLLAGHPLLFDEQNGEQITLEIRPVEILVRETDNACHVSLSVTPHEYDDYCLWKVGNNQWAVCVFTPEQRSIYDTLGEKGVDIPLEGKQRLIELTHKAPVPVLMEIKAEERPADCLPVVQLRQEGGSFAASLRIRPAPECESLLPASGMVDILTDSKGKTVRFHRNFAEEEKNAKNLIASCPTLARQIEGWEWLAAEPDDILNLLAELHAASEMCRVEWPQGAKVRLAGEVRRTDITVRTGSSDNDWFSLSGDVKVSPERVVALKDILERIDASHGRYVELSPGEFLALTEETARALRRIKLLSSRQKGGERALHPLAAAVSDNMFAGMALQSDTNWKNAVSRIHKALEITPTIPPALQAELRPYQREGFVWLCRLSAWGVGACLADDMGLGKTLQTIAVMLLESRKGPCLVVAPTSVCPNWESEIHRFAPSLDVQRLRDADDRRQTVQNIAKGTVLIVGYGLLHRESEILSSKNWRMVVFDEAQALKNFATKRSKSAANLPADFRLALTGTPIENHLDDLWSLFSILNPGLLGTHTEFHRRFSGAAAGGQAATALKMLLRPFILRRLKSQVLDDLPPLTEQTILVEPTEKEQHFYEALRQRSIEKLEELSAKDLGNQRRFCILTELTRLRRACCHASLAIPEAINEVEPVSAKMACFMDLLQEARDGGHRVLVFSQFVTFLTLIRSQLDKQNIAYKYLDGSTPEEARRTNVEAFQRGEGDVFLISLKAGGQGLNLTGADYVIHLDPWWNPAVEDQATDRAHRIGQERPVTVYRLAVAHTVEEKILALHEKKRELAADFLEGTEDAANITKLTEDELLALLG